MNSEHVGESEDAGGYVHRPDGRTDAGNAAETRGVDTRGWVLLGVVVLCFLVIPGVIYLRPATPTEAGLPFLAAMLVLPMLPAVLLGLTAVWSMKRNG